MKAFMRLGLPEDIRWLIEAKVRLAGEFQDSYNRFMPGMGRSSYSKKRRAKRMRVCHKCARWTCDMHCRNIGMASIIVKIKFNSSRMDWEKNSWMISGWLLRRILVDRFNDIFSSYLLETIQRRKGAHQSRESDGKRPCLPVYKKTGWEANPRLIEGV